MADCRPSRQALEDFLIAEHIGHESHVLVGMETHTVAGDNAATLLAAVLQRVEPEIGQVGCLRMVEYAEDAALFFWSFEFHWLFSTP